MKREASIANEDESLADFVIRHFPLPQGPASDVRRWHHLCPCVARSPPDLVGIAGNSEELARQGAGRRPHSMSRWTGFPVSLR